MKKDEKKNEEIRLMLAKKFLACYPFSTKVYMALKTKIPMDFIIKNWDKIIS